MTSRSEQAPASGWDLVLRGDDDAVDIGAGVSVLENCVIEAPKGHPVKVGDGTIISHGAVIHGAAIGEDVLIGIGAIVLDGAEVGSRSIVGSGALISPNTIVTPNQLVLGIPAKPIREVRDGERDMVAKEQERTCAKAFEYKKIFGCQ